MLRLANIERGHHYSSGQKDMDDDIEPGILEISISEKHLGAQCVI